MLVDSGGHKDSPGGGCTIGRHGAWGMGVLVVVIRTWSVVLKRQGASPREERRLPGKEPLSLYEEGEWKTYEGGETTYQD